MTKPKEKTETAATGNGVPQTTPAERVKLLEIKKRLITVRVRGLTPYIPHAWSVKTMRMMEEKQQKKAKEGGREAKDPQAEYEGCFYRDEEGRACIPAAAFKKAVISAATAIDDKLEFPKTRIRQAIFFKGDKLPIHSEGGPRMRTDFPRNTNGNPDVRYRPEFLDWEVELLVEFNAMVYSAEQVINIINLAGFGVGVGDWRPEKDGEFGRFEVVKD